MIRANPSQSDPFSQSVGLLRELHLLTVEGKDETDEADRIRDAMDGPWGQLNSEERARLRGLSADLYSIGEDFASPAVPSDRGAAEFDQAFHSRDWDKALEILREQQGLLPAGVAALRGVVWAELGYHEIAALFFTEAYRLQPRNIDLKASYLRALVHAGHTAEASEQALEGINAATDPYELLLSAEILFDCVQSGGGATESEFRQIINLIERGLTLMGESPLDQSWARRVCSAYLTMALCFDSIGDDWRAAELYEKARSVQSATSDFIPPQFLPARADPASKGFHDLLEQARNNLDIEFQSTTASILTSS